MRCDASPVALARSVLALRGMRPSLVHAVFLAFFFFVRPAIAADDAGDGGATGDSATADGGGSDANCGGNGADPSGVCCDEGGACDAGGVTDGASGDGFVIACNGALCDTTTGGQCGVARGSLGRAQFDAGLLAAPLTFLALLIVRRRRHRLSC